LLDAKRIGEWLREARKTQGQFSQEKAAGKVGTTARTLYAWETGEAAPPTDTFFALVALYGADILTLVPQTGGKNGIPPWTMKPLPASKAPGKGKHGA
jgi:transcriptional regulator with XRE-family HTH domain